VGNADALEASGMIYRLLLIASTLILMAFQQDEGTADHCDNNSKNPEHACSCSSAMMCGKDDRRVEPDKKCRTYCRPTACACKATCHIT
jgi:hypothetical protein